MLVLAGVHDQISILLYINLEFFKEDTSSAEATPPPQDGKRGRPSGKQTKTALVVHGSRNMGRQNQGSPAVGGHLARGPKKPALQTRRALASVLEQLRRLSQRPLLHPQQFRALARTTHPNTRRLVRDGELCATPGSLASTSTKCLSSQGTGQCLQRDQTMVSCRIRSGGRG